jgi:hypothetical protein
VSYERELQLTAERVRQLPPARREPRESQVYAVLEAMTPRPVPRLRSLAWGDQLWVIGRDVPDEARAGLIEVLRELRRGCDLPL